jgi:beta-lactamase superfamily II metal-dependent hydrolase
MGDATSNVEKEILNKNLSSTVLKVGHHGSKYSSSAAFLAKVRPKYSVISVAKANEYYHPHGVVLDKLRKLNSEILRTDELGTIVALSDGKNVSFKYIYTNTNGG